MHVGHEEQHEAQIVNTGLGLAVVRQLAEAAGGSARLEPASPSGLTAIASLPVVAS